MDDDEHFVANTLGLLQRPLGTALRVFVSAEAKTSAGAPCRICSASVLEDANEYRGRLSIVGKKSVSDDAPKTVIREAARSSREAHEHREGDDCAGRRAEPSSQHLTRCRS